MSKPQKRKRLISVELIPLGAASPTKTALNINPRATEQEITEIGTVLAGIEFARSWWIGDLGLEMQARKKREQLKLKPGTPDEDADNEGAHYTFQRAEAWGIDRGYWHNCVMVCRYYARDIRTDLPFTHHVIAMLAAGGAKSDPLKAVAWLLKAKEKGWSVSQMRHEVNLSLSTTPAPTITPDPNPFAPLDDADHWAAEQKDTELTPDLAKACLTRFAGLIAFIDRLRAAAAEERAQA